jgi:hypothetical protein
MVTSGTASATSLTVARGFQVAGVFAVALGIVYYSSGIASNLVTASVRPTSLVPEPVEYDTFSIFSGQCHCANLKPTNRSAAAVPCDGMFQAVSAFANKYINPVSQYLVFAAGLAGLDLVYFARNSANSNAAASALAVVVRIAAVGLIAFTAWLNIGASFFLGTVYDGICPPGSNLRDYGATFGPRYYLRLAETAVHVALAIAALLVLVFGSRRPAGVVLFCAAVILVWGNVDAQPPSYFEIPGGIVKHLKGKAFAPGFKGEGVGLWHVCDCKPFACEDEQGTLFRVKGLLTVGGIAMALTLIAAGYELTFSPAGVTGWLTAASGAVAVLTGSLGWQMFRDWFMPKGTVAHCAAGVGFMNNQQFAWGYYLMGMPGLYWFATGLAFLAVGALIARPRV